MMGQDTVFDLAPGINPHVVRQTSAAAIALPTAMHLARITLKGHATEPTVLGCRYDGQFRALFFCEADGWAEYDVDWGPVKTLDNSVFTVVSDDAPQAWTLTFDDQGYGPNVAEYKAIFFECEVADTGTAVTVSFPVDSVPQWIIGGQTTGVASANARWTFQSIGDRQVTVEVGDNPASKMLPKQAPPLPKSDSLTLTPTVSGAATYAVAVVGYKAAQ